MSEQKTSDKYEVLSVKIRPDQAVLLNAICDTLGVNTYQIFQMFFYTLCKAAAPMHELSPEIRKIMTLMETDVGWANAFNMANPNHLHVAQAILILEQEGKKGFGAVMIDKPFMDKAPEKVDDIDPHRNDPQMTENVDYILEEIAKAEESLANKAEFICKMACVKQSSSSCWFPAEIVKKMFGHRLALEDLKNHYCLATVQNKC